MVRMKKIKLFFEGLSTIIKYSVVTDNISINKSSSSPVYINDDLEALRNDWETVGNNLKASIENYEQEYKSRF
jgi:hypothetical protein